MPFATKPVRTNDATICSQRVSANLCSFYSISWWWCFRAPSLSALCDTHILECSIRSAWSCPREHCTTQLRRSSPDTSTTSTEHDKIELQPANTSRECSHAGWYGGKRLQHLNRPRSTVRTPPSTQTQVVHNSLSSQRRRFLHLASRHDATRTEHTCFHSPPSCGDTPLDETRDTYVVRFSKRRQAMGDLDGEESQQPPVRSLHQVWRHLQLWYALRAESGRRGWVRGTRCG